MATAEQIKAFDDLMQKGLYKEAADYGRNVAGASDADIATYVGGGDASKASQAKGFLDSYQSPKTQQPGQQPVNTPVAPVVTAPPPAPNPTAPPAQPQAPDPYYKFIHNGIANPTTVEPSKPNTPVVTQPPSNNTPTVSSNVGGINVAPWASPGTQIAAQAQQTQQVMTDASKALSNTLLKGSKYSASDPHVLAGQTFASAALGNAYGAVNDPDSLAAAYQKRKAAGGLSTNELSHWKTAAYLMGIDPANLPEELKNVPYGLGNNDPNSPYGKALVTYAKAAGVPDVTDRDSLIAAYDKRLKSGTPISDMEAENWRVAAALAGIDTTGIDLKTGGLLNAKQQNAGLVNGNSGTTWDGRINIGSLSSPIWVDPMQVYNNGQSGVTQDQINKALNINGGLPDTSKYQANLMKGQDYQALIDFMMQNKAAVPTATAAQAQYADKVNASNIDLNQNGLQAQVRPEDTSQFQLNKMLNENGLLMQNAKGRALMESNGRGLLNSSIAVGAGQDAMIQNAQPFALQDAKTYENERIQNQNVASSILQANQKAAMDAQLANQKEQENVNLANAGYQQDINKLNATNAFDANTQAAQMGMDTAKNTYLANIDAINKANLAGTQSNLNINQAYAQNLFDVAKQDAVGKTAAKQSLLDAMLKRGQDIGAASDTQSTNAQTFGFNTALADQKAMNDQEMAILNGKITQANAQQAFEFDLSKIKTEQQWKSYESALDRATQIKMAEYDITAKQIASNGQITAASINAQTNASSDRYRVDKETEIKLQQLDKQTNTEKAQIFTTIYQSGLNNKVDPARMEQTLNFAGKGLGFGDNVGTQMMGGKSASSIVSGAQSDPSTKITATNSTGMTFSSAEDYNTWMKNNNLSSPQSIQALSPSDQKKVQNTLLNTAYNGGFSTSISMMDPYKAAEALGFDSAFNKQFESAVKGSPLLGGVTP